MKKTLLTLGIVAMFALNGNAQDHTKTTKTDKTEKPAPAVNADGTAAPEGGNQATKTEPAKKSTRMAVNQKGTPGGTKKKEEPVTNPK
ncbi:MAG TPA: hypothetical protein PLU73_08170 [Bacteroidia bacterium]|nr:hypothetical protein [Bacteroidia bacterium]